MDRMKRIMALTVSILAVAILASASSWEGSAMIGSSGDFPPGGFFAACNSFPRNTAVEVTNLETGKTVTVIVVRGLDNPGVFMMVSAEAAEAIGLRQGRITRIRAVEPRSVSSLAPSTGSRTALDGDFNPRLLATEELKRMGYDLEGSPIETPVAPVKAPSTPEVVSVIKAPESPTLEPEVVPEPGVAVPEPALEVKDTSLAVIAPLSIPPLKEDPDLVQDLERLEPEVAEPEPVPIPSPSVPRVAVDESPDAINGGKPKPVRTIVLPELPEPEAQLALTVIDPLADEGATGPASVDVLEEPVQEIFTMTLPVPDETPLRVSPSMVPRRFEAPAALPDVLDRLRLVQLAPEMVELSLAEPEVPGPEGVVALPLEIPPSGEAGTALALTEPEAEEEDSATPEVRGSPTRIASDGSVALAEPVPGLLDRVVAHELMAPVRRNGLPLATLAWPELEADEIPDVVLARLTEPAQMIPATSLAEGEVIFPPTEAPSAVALETPSFAAAETRIALAVPELESLDQAEADVTTGDPLAATREAPVPVVTAPGVAMERPDLVDGLPGEVIVVLEPTDLKPPVAGAPVVGETPPPAKAPVPGIKPPEPVKTGPAAVPVKPAMATGALEKGRHYIQVGAYRTEAAVAETVAMLRMDYVIVLEAPTGSTMRTWKIFVGPLGRDESGLALLRVRSLGFRDAFLKIGG